MKPPARSLLYALALLGIGLVTLLAVAPLIGDDLPWWRTALAWAVLPVLCLGPGLYALVGVLRGRPESRMPRR